MARMTDLPAAEREALERLECRPYGGEPWVRGRPLAERTVAIVSSAGLMLRDERPMLPGDSRYRVIPDDVPDAEILMGHISPNFDRTGFQMDANVVLPRAPLAALAAAGAIGSVAPRHYSFMGATAPAEMDPHARRLAGELHASGVDTALLVPV